MNLAVPHPVFDLTLADVAAAGSTIRNARPGLWRYLLMEGSAAVGSAEVAVDDGGNAERVSILNTGPFVAATERGIRYAERLPQVQRDAYELRLLRIPALYVLALWLKHAVDVNDIIVPLAPAPRYLVPERPYGPLEFLQALRGPAKDRLGFDDTPRDVVR